MCLRYDPRTFPYTDASENDLSRDYKEVQSNNLMCNEGK